MKSLSELQAEATRLANELNDNDIIMADDWREFLEERREYVWSEINKLAQ